MGGVEKIVDRERPDGTRMYIFGTGGVERMSKDAGFPFIGSIPMDGRVREGGDNGLPIVFAQPDAPAAAALRAMAEDVAAKVSMAALSSGNTIPISMVG